MYMYMCMYIDNDMNESCDVVLSDMMALCHVMSCTCALSHVTDHVTLPG